MTTQDPTQHTEMMPEEMAGSIIESFMLQFNCPPTSPWTAWADTFLRQATETDNPSNGHNGHRQPADRNGSRSAHSDDALMDCYNG